MKTSENKSVTPTGNGFILGTVCMLLATIFWGVNIPVVKALVPEWMDANAVTAIRILGACVLFWVCSLFVKTSRIERGDWWRLVVGGAVGLFAFIFLLNFSLKYANPIDVSIIMTLPPVFVILIGVVFQGRRPSGIEYLGVGIAFIGALIVILCGKNGAKGSDNLLGDIIALASTICYSVYLVITERPSHTYTPVTMLRWTFLFASVPALILVPSLLDMPIMQTSETAPWIEGFFILLCPSFLAYFS